MTSIQDGLRALAEGRTVDGLLLSWGIHVLGIRGQAAWIDVGGDGIVRERRMQTGMAAPAARDVGRVSPNELRELASALLQHRFETLAPPTAPGGQQITIDAMLGSERVRVELPGTESSRPELREIGGVFTKLRAMAQTAGMGAASAPAAPAAPAPAAPASPPPAAPAASAPAAPAASPVAAVGDLAKSGSPNVPLIAASCLWILILSCCMTSPGLFARLRMRSAMRGGGVPTGGGEAPSSDGLGFSELTIQEGGLWKGKIDEDGNVFRDGLNVGKIHSDGQVQMGTFVGSVDADGTIRKGGLVYGEVTDDGRLKVNGLEKGSINEDGNIFIGTHWGYVGGFKNTSGCRRAVAAYMVFFAGAL